MENIINNRLSSRVARIPFARSGVIKLIDRSMYWMKFVTENKKKLENIVVLLRFYYCSNS
jgi:hypothetical protein